MNTKTLSKNKREIFAAYSADCWGELYRLIYKYTDCGPSLGVQFSGMDRPVYCDQLRDFNKTRRQALAIHVSSIVEGVEQTTDTHVVDMTKPGAAKRFDAAIEAVSKEADDIWNETHGCVKCAELQGITEESRRVEHRVPSREVPIVENCPQCKGHGVII